MSRSKLVIRDNSTLRAQYESLRQGDIIVGRLRLRESEEPLLLDLCIRGVHLIPSGLSQLASRSKTFQTALFAQYMLPLTRAIHSHHDLVNAISDYEKNAITAVVTKLDRRNAGMGVHLWPSVEEVFTHASLGNIPFPFVLQPFMPYSRDIRVVFLDDYIEAYWRHNPHNFRNNLHQGGQSKPCELSPAQLKLCRQVMKRGQFPYGHLDIIVTEEKKFYLGEVNLRGGIRGAQISPADYQARVEAIHQQLLDTYLK
ncbi:MAG: 30S ribosomal protein S6 modification protein RimK [Desulfobacterales bacterium SG8_35_2]|nr:MAG: 30S ribosomal protein S6 modification protein RimK [Desulfobacterales bacterium SG8_35_2]